MKLFPGLSWRWLSLTVALLLAAVAARSIADPPAANPNPGPSPAPKASSESDLLPLPRIPVAVSSLLQDRDYTAAVRAIDAASKDKDSPRDYLAYLKGRALQLGGQNDAAAAQFDRFARDFPNSPWARRARFGKAVALARKGDFQGAEAIYRAEVEQLLSPARKQQIADLYLEFADAYFKPKDELQHKPDYQKALEFYLQALEEQPAGERRIAVELDVARCHQLLNQLPQAAEKYALFIKDHPDAAAVVEARFRLGEVQLAQGQAEEARRTWQDLLSLFPDSRSERIAEAAYNLSLTYGIPNPASDENLNLGVAALESFLKHFPSHKRAAEAHLRIAASYMSRGRHGEAVNSLNHFLSDPRYADREELADARNLLGRSYQLERKYAEALAAWREYLAKYPSHHAWSEVQRAIVDTEFLMAEDKAHAKQFDDARRLWTEFMQKYPLDPRDPAILDRFAQMQFEQGKFVEAISDWRRLASKYPGTEEASRGQFMIGLTLETRLGKLEEALKEYKLVQAGGFVPHAQVAIARLTAKTMSITTERVFRLDETPKLRLISRNIPAVSVRAYRVDLEAYFRKMHAIQGVEGLDIALIDPDRTIEYKVPKYADYQETENEVAVSLAPTKKGTAEGADDADKKMAGGKALAMAVTVSSKTLEATTLVIQSDLDLIVKCSRDELFVFAENMRTGKPWPKVRLLVSDGKQVFAEGVTGDDGVFKQSYKELRDAADVRVLGLADGGVASNIVGLQGVGVAQGLADKGYIYTDRPVYRAGQLVHVRGVLRRAVDDNYQVQSGAAYTLEVVDPRSRAIWQEPVKLSEYGSFWAHFTLPETSPVGDYRLRVFDAEGHSHEGTFQVRAYQLEPIRLSVETDRRVYYRGETIEGRIKAAFYYGAPLADREVQYQLADGRMMTDRTDAKGEIHFKFSTREFRESQTLRLTAVLPERNLMAAQNFYLATQGFGFTLSTVRPVFVAGESFEATIKTLDAEGKPLAQKFTLHVLERTRVDGKLGERPVEEHELTTEAKTGTAHQTLALKEGGEYILRAEGIDRFEHPVTDQYVVQISDDRDPVRLRILADRHTFQVGDKATVQIHWRQQPALALVTFQGARVLDYRLVRLEKGANALVIPMSARLAPNFDLCVSVMTDPRSAEKTAGRTGGQINTESLGTLPGPLAVSPPAVRFHETSSPFTVERPLQIRLKTSRKAGADPKSPIQPGEDIDLTIRATDPQGKPVRAELSLGMVEQALLGMFEGTATPIDDIFRGAPRQSALRSSSSIDFAYNPATRPIDRQLLSEAERLEVAAEENGERHSLTPFLNTFEAERQIRVGQILREQETGLDQKRDPQGAVDVEGTTITDSATLELGSSAGTLILSGKGAGNVRHGTWRGTGMTTSKVWDRLSLSHDGQPIDGRDYDSKIELIKPTIIIQEEEGVKLLNWDDQIKSFVRRDDAAGLQSSIALLSGGKQFNLNFARELGEKADAQKIAALAHKLAGAGAVLLPQRGPQETGYWNPAVVTDENGEAHLTITLPDQSTAWQLSAKGITADTLAGEAQTELSAEKPLFGELKLPAAFTDGDEAQVQVTVHNSAVDRGPIEVTLKTTIGSKSVEEHKTLHPTAKGLLELSFPTSIRRPAVEKAAADKTDAKTDDDSPAADADATFELIVAAGAQRDVLRRVVPIHPFGLPVYATAGGSAAADTTVWIEAPPSIHANDATLQILIGPTVEQSMLDVLFAPPPPCQMDFLRVASDLDSTTSDLLAALSLEKLLGSSRDSAGPHAAAFDGRVRSAVSLLISAQQDDGGWSWTGRSGTSHRLTSARVIWGLSLAKRAGYKMPEDRFEKAIAYLQSQIALTGQTDYESKAVLLHALAAAGRADFTLANRLYRNRPSLSAAALAHLALALADTDHKPMAQDLLTLLATRKLDEPIAPRGASITSADSYAWNQSAVEVRALYALALEEAQPDSPKIKELVDWLMAHRAGNRWSPDKATGPAAAAAAGWFAKNRFEQAGDTHYQLSVFVNDLQVKTLDVDPRSLTQTVNVPARMLQKGKQRIHFQLTGRGRYTFQAILSGFVPANQLKSGTRGWYVRRTYEPAPLELDGREIPRGFDIVQGPHKTFSNPLTELPVGRRGHVSLEIWRNMPAAAPEEQLEYLVVTEPLPAGTTPIESSIAGGFERYEIGPGQITFYIGSRPYVERIGFDVHGYLPGQYRAIPTVVRNAYRPDQMALAETDDAADVKSLAVLPLGAKSADPYRRTPRELFELGKRLFEKGAEHYPEAGARLAELLANWNVNADVYKESARMLLDIHLQTGPPTEVVRYFEIIKEKWPELELPFDKIVKVAAAYDQIGEYERSYLVFRATTESSFLRESAVAGFLDGRGEFVRSVAVMNRLLAEYPPEPYVAAATFALSQRVYAKAATAADDPLLRERKINRVDLIAQALAMLEHFLSEYPDDPAADQGAFSEANALLELRAYKQVIGQAGKFAVRYPKSDYLDSFWYIAAYGHFALGEHEQALAMARKVSEHQRVDPQTGREVESPNKWEAIYIMGQVYHSLGDAARAIAEYTRVEDRFADAKQAIEYFTRKDMSLPEVTVIRPGKLAEVELKFRNVANVDVKVYRIDLMKFGLLKRNLAGITQINLSGIRPLHNATIDLGDGRDYRDRSRQLPLPLKDEGAYLLVCRGGDLYASGLVLISPLAVEAQEDAAAGQVRVTVKDVLSDRYVSDVHVKVIGSRNDDFISGQTDLRGVFSTQGIRGTGTVLAQTATGRYAFFRGTTELGPPAGFTAPAAPTNYKVMVAPPAQDLDKQNGSLLQNVQQGNKSLQGQQGGQLKNLYEQKKGGVKAKEAY